MELTKGVKLSNQELIEALEIQGGALQPVCQMLDKNFRSHQETLTLGDVTVAGLRMTPYERKAY